jgi:hypothetical protein
LLYSFANIPGIGIRHGLDHYRVTMADEDPPYCNRIGFAAPKWTERLGITSFFIEFRRRHCLVLSPIFKKN